jgi:hypothetical protein
MQDFALFFCGAAGLHSGLLHNRLLILSLFLREGIWDNGWAYDLHCTLERVWVLLQWHIVIRFSNVKNPQEEVERRDYED